MKKLTIKELHDLVNDKTLSRVGIHSKRANDVTLDFIQANITTPSPLNYEVNLNDKWVTVRWNKRSGTVLSMRPFDEIDYYKLDNFLICDYKQDEQNLPCVVIIQLT